MASANHAKSSTVIRNNARNLLITFAAYLLLLVFCETVLYCRMQGAFPGFSLWMYAFAPAEAMFLTFLSGWFRRDAADRIVNGILAGIITLYYISQAVYFQIFGSVYSLSMIGMGGDAVTNFGWTMGSTFRSCIGILLLLLLPLIAWIVLRRLRFKRLHYCGVFHGAAALATAILWLLAVLLLPLGGKEQHSAYGAYYAALVDTDTSAAKIGVLTNSVVEIGRMLSNGFTDHTDELADPDLSDADFSLPDEPQAPTVNTQPHVLKELDFSRLAAEAPKDEIKSLCEYLAKQSGTNRNEYTGLFADCNLIYICAESFSSYAVDPVITPTLYKLANEGIVLDHYYNAFKNTTTNGEFAFLTSLWPDVSRYAKMGTNKGSFAQSAGNLMPMGMGTIFQQQRGNVSHGYHNFRGSYYCRNETLPNLGFTCKFMNDGMKFTTSWPSSDLEMMEQSMDDYINDDRFFAYYMTFSGHGPYTDENVMYNRNIAAVKKLIGGRELTDGAQGYFAANYELEKAMAYLLQRLEAAGKLNNTVIVLTGDHYPYYLDAAGRNSIAGHKVDTDFEMYQSTCTIWKGGMESLHVGTYCCNVDILPTILNLFDIEYDSRLLCGSDIFSDATHVAMLYNKSFITDGVRFNSVSGKALWDETVTASDEEKEKTVAAMTDYVTNKYLLALKIVDTDFYRYVWEKSGLSAQTAAVKQP